MAKLTGDNGEVRRQSVRGRFYVYVRRGQIVMAAWPKKRKGAMSAKQAEAVEKFRQAALATKFMDAQDQQTAYQLIKGTNALPRDLLMMALYGRLGTFFLNDGTRIYSVATLMDATALLDAISYTPGAMVYRDGNNWWPILPGNPGDILSLTEGDIPAWVPNAGGGAGWWFDPPQASDFTLASGDGNTMTLTNDTDAGLLFNGGPQVTGDQNRWGYIDVPDPASDWTCTARMEFIQDAVNYSHCGLACQRSANSRLLNVAVHASGTIAMASLPGLTGFNALIGTRTFTYRPVWWQIKKTSNTVTTYVSNDGKQFSFVGSQSTFTYLGGDPDRVGLQVGYNRSSGQPIIGTLQHFDFQQ